MKFDPPYISIFIKDMRVNVRVGLLEAERVSPQPLDISVELFVAPSYLKGVDETNIVDYADIYKAIKTWEDREHVELLESLLGEIVELGFGFEGVEALRASIAKPAIFDEAHGAGLSAYLRRADYSR